NTASRSRMSRSKCLKLRVDESSRPRFHVVSPCRPKKTARMLLSTPITSCPCPSKNVTASEPISPLEPVTRTFMSIARHCSIAAACDQFSAVSRMHLDQVSQEVGLTVKNLPANEVHRHNKNLGRAIHEIESAGETLAMKLYNRLFLDHHHLILRPHLLRALAASVNDLRVRLEIDLPSAAIHADAPFEGLAIPEAIFVDTPDLVDHHAFAHHRRSGDQRNRSPHVIIPVPAKQPVSGQASREQSVELKFFDHDRQRCRTEWDHACSQHSVLIDQPRCCDTDLFIDFKRFDQLIYTAGRNYRVR